VCGIIGAANINNDDKLCWIDSTFFAQCAQLFSTIAQAWPTLMIALRVSSQRRQIAWLLLAVTGIGLMSVTQPLASWILKEMVLEMGEVQRGAAQLSDCCSVGCEKCTSEPPENHQNERENRFWCHGMK